MIDSLAHMTRDGSHRPLQHPAPQKKGQTRLERHQTPDEVSPPAAPFPRAPRGNGKRLRHLHHSLTLHSVHPGLSEVPAFEGSQHVQVQFSQLGEGRRNTRHPFLPTDEARPHLAYLLRRNGKIGQLLSNGTQRDRVVLLELKFPERAPSCFGRGPDI